VKTLVSVDWDYYSGTVEHVFDAPVWGTRDHEEDRTLAWRNRALKRDPHATSWNALGDDYPLYGNPDELLAYRNLPVYVAWSHAHAWTWLERHPGRRVVNHDSHHDLYSRSGDPHRVRPGNWAGLALARDLVSSYVCVYPAWHARVRVTEGYDLDRTRDETDPHLPPGVRARVRLGRGEALPARADVESVLLVQSPAWTSPAHDDAFRRLVRHLGAVPISAPYARPWRHE